MHRTLPKGFILSCALLLAASGWLAGANAASTSIFSVTSPNASSTTAAAVVVNGSCDERVCMRPNCSCESDQPPAGLRPSQVPQFVTLTFDDAVNVGNMAFYRELLNGTRKNKNNCRIAATFFVSHEYTDYEAVNQLYSWGNEIALHSISHRTDSAYWQTINTTQWEREVAAQKEMMETFANVPASNVTGVRGPFLYTGGDEGFRMLQKHFRYDCTLVHRRERDHENPVYPYTMDYGFRRNCMVWPCPKDTYAGLWVVPMNVFFKERLGQDYPCAMADACLPQPLTADDTFEYLRSNFEDYYNRSHAPFPPVPPRSLLAPPRPQAGLPAQACPTAQQSTCTKPKTCTYKNTSLGGDRYMRTCSRCPRNYPWVGNPMGI
ncbi:hypothetical protein MRX96_019654 [Rhipicephalus microplus]